MLLKEFDAGQESAARVVPVKTTKAAEAAGGLAISPNTCSARASGDG
jgi:hypothetical protein